MILTICLSGLFISLAAMDYFCKTCIETDLVTLNYVTFIEPFAVFPTQALSFDSEQIMNNSIDKLIESKINDPFILFEEHFFTVVLVYKNPYEVQFEDMTDEVLEFFS
jgi:hypothetical protein